MQGRPRLRTRWASAPAEAPSPPGAAAPGPSPAAPTPARNSTQHEYKVSPPRPPLATGLARTRVRRRGPRTMRASSAHAVFTTCISPSPSWLYTLSCNFIDGERTEDRYPSERSSENLCERLAGGWHHLPRAASDMDVAQRRGGRARLAGQVALPPPAVGALLREQEVDGALDRVRPCARRAHESAARSHCLRPHVPLRAGFPRSPRHRAHRSTRTRQPRGPGCRTTSRK